MVVAVVVADSCEIRGVTMQGFCVERGTVEIEATAEFGGETRFERAISMVRDQVDEVLKMENGQVSIILAGDKASFLVDRAGVTSRSDIDTELDKLTDPAARSRDRIVKKSEKDGFYTALDLGCVWLERALAGK